MRIRMAANIANKPSTCEQEGHEKMGTGEGV